MAEIFVVNTSSDLANQYVSDLPVVNETPVARQIGFYLPKVATEYETELATYLTDNGSTFAGIATAAAGASAITALVGVAGGITEATINAAWGAGLADVLAGTATIEEILRILTGADSAMAETGVVGNTRLIGGKRRIYLRDRTSASMGEGFLRHYTDTGDLAVYLSDGSIL